MSKDKDSEWIEKSGGYEWTPGSPWPPNVPDYIADVDDQRAHHFQQSKMSGESAKYSPQHSDYYYDYNRNDPDRENPFTEAFDQYTSVYSGILQNNDPVSTWTTKVQKTKAGGGYHQWHCENGQFLYRDRVLAWMVYLNTVPSQNGGGTDFLHQKLTLQPEAGTIVLWPASYTHVHRGGFLTGNVDKYIATGWFIREPT